GKEAAGPQEPETLVTEVEEALHGHGLALELDVLALALQVAFSAPLPVPAPTPASPPVPGLARASLVASGPPVGALAVAGPFLPAAPLPGWRRRSAAGRARARGFGGRLGLGFVALGSAPGAGRVVGARGGGSGVIRSLSLGRCLGRCLGRSLGRRTRPVSVGLGRDLGPGRFRRPRPRGPAPAGLGCG